MDRSRWQEAWMIVQNEIIPNALGEMEKQMEGLKRLEQLVTFYGDQSFASLVALLRKDLETVECLEEAVKRGLLKMGTSPKEREVLADKTRRAGDAMKDLELPS